MERFSIIIEKMFCITEHEERKMSYSNDDDVFEGYKIKSALTFKIFSTLLF